MAAEGLYHPDLNLPYPDADREVAQECSVRGCHRSIEPNGQNKMCDECRSRHRGYATTKRLRRKLEKAALQAMEVTGEAPIVPMDIQEWDPTIDPILYDVSRPATSTPGPSISLSSSTSELANALTYYHQEPLSQFQENVPIPETPPCISPAMLQGDSTESTPAPTIEEAQDASPTRFCSVKGCKAVIPGSYDYKMCPSCRTRYRGYGITKRAKWKNEREAFEKEMTNLRAAEDERRTANGEPPLAEDPVALKKWEMTILDEEIALPPPVLAALKTAGIKADGTLEPGSSALSLYHNDPSQPSEIDTPHATVPYPSVPGSIPQLPARMCTVSHCHQILPGYCRYKRCEQHRLQNRHHSKLKRVREKVEKAIGPKEGAHVVEIPSEAAEPKRKGKATEPGPATISEGAMIEGSETEEVHEVVPQPEAAAPAKKKKARKVTHCVTEGCGKPLQEAKRWKNCDDCRAEERRTKQRTKDQARLGKDSPPIVVVPTETTNVEPVITAAVSDPPAAASTTNTNSQPLKLVNMTADTFETPEPPFRWSNEMTVIAVDSSAPLDLPRSSSSQQPLTIRHYKPKESDKSGSRPSTGQPYVIVEQFPFREIHAVPPHESSGFSEPALPSITGSSLPTTVHKPYPNSGVFRHYVPIEDRSPGPPSTNPTSPTEHLPTTSRMADSVLTPASPGDQSDAVAPPIPNTESLASASAVKKPAGTKSKSKGKGKEKATEAPVPSIAPAANLVPQLYQYPPYPVHPYFYLPPQYNPNAASPAYVYPGYPPIIAPSASGEPPCVGGKPSGSAPAARGASAVVPSPSSISASAPSQGLLTVPYPYPFPHPQAPGFHYAFPASAAAPPSTATAGLGAVPFPYYYPPYPYSASAPPAPSFLGAPLSAPLLPAAGPRSTGELGTSISAPLAKPAPLSSPTSVSAPVGTGPASASTTVAKSSRPLKEPAKDPTEPRFSYYHHGFGTTDSPDAPTMATDGTKKRRKIDPAWLEKQRLKAEQEKQQQEATSTSTHMNPMVGWVGNGNLAPPAATGSGVPQAVPAQQAIIEPPAPMSVDTEVPVQLEDLASSSSSATQLARYPCSNKACKRRVASASGTALCVKCKTKFRKHAEKNKRKHNLVPVKPVSATSVGIDLGAGKA